MRKLAVVAVAAIAVLAVDSASAGERRELVIASGEVTGYYYPVAGALCRVLNKDKPHGYTCVVAPTSGSAANVAALRSGEADLAILQSRAASLAATGGEGFKDGPFPELRAVMSLHDESALALTRSGSGVEQLRDLKGKRVNLGRPGSFQRTMADAVLAAGGLSEGDMAPVVELDTADAAQELCDGNIDAAFFSGVHPMTEAASAIEQCGAVPVPLGGKSLETTLKQSPWLAKTVIKGDTYDGLREDRPALAVTAVLVATTRLPADEVYDILKEIHANFPALVRLHPVLNGLTKKRSARDGIAIPLHEGAAKFYADSGLAK
ncbi:MAG: TAXI family TRAP transporter solute-binding subunit [Magnetospirillum sp.]|nr:TAXI family TRAP transporter solute-binding subunit [Magnetospirillum sp.]